MTSTYDLAQARRHDLCATRNAIRFDQSSASIEMETAISIAESPASRHVYLRTMFDEARSLAADTSKMQLPLAGLAVSVKDLFDIGGQTSAAGSTVLADDAPAPHDCPAVARIRASGGVVIGRTNMVEFAFSGVGINPHFGTPANPRSPGLARVPGGSSSGAAVSVATGSAFVGLGSDTGGSIRIPAALNGIVGFKPTARLVPTEGAIPLSTTLDTVCAMTRSVRDAMVVHEILSAQTIIRSPAPLSSYRLAVVKPLMQDGLDHTVARVWQRTLDALRSNGAWIREIDLPEIGELPAIGATGGFSAAESYAWHFKMLQTHSAQYDPRVLTRIQRGASMSAREYFELHALRKSWITRVEAALQAYDAVLSPTVPIVAPPMAEVAPGPERDAAFFSANALLLRNTSVVNMLDGCAISIPCHGPEELPVGLMIWAAAMKDDTVLNIAHQVEASLAQSQL